jgi:pyrroloquinoline-quinone synthase
MDLWNRLEELRRCWNVLDHPFYERWSAGSLTRPELALYAGEYRHAVVALAKASAAAAAASTDPTERSQLEAHAAEEAAHVELWDAFAGAVGADLDRAPAWETELCARHWAGYRRSLAGHLAALYAIESAQPAISAIKAAGLRMHYGFESGPATAYFDIHTERDVVHAAEGRALLERHAAGEDPHSLAAEAGRVLRSNWTLLDGVERQLDARPT